MKHGQKYKMAKRAGFLLHTNIHIELTNTLAKLFIKKKTQKKNCTFSTVVLEIVTIYEFPAQSL